MEEVLNFGDIVGFKKLAPDVSLYFGTALW